MTGAPAERPLDVFIVAGEESGDKLGGPLMAALKLQLGGQVRFRGVGGSAMEAEGLTSQFSIEDVSAIGFASVIARLRLILRRIRETAAAATVSSPDLLLLIDSPDFTHRVAKRVRRVLPDLPVVKYVSPTVWVWRPGRSPAMRAYVDHILALFPFEPEVHRKLRGPACTYVGHPLLERLQELRPQNDEENSKRENLEKPLVLMLPGSRRSEIARLGEIFGDVATRIRHAHPGAEFVLPTPAKRLAQIESMIAKWPVKPRIVTGDDEKYAAFRNARAAVAASGTVTLELALAQVPMVAAYRVPRLEGAIVRQMVKVNSAILPNILLNENIVPEFLQGDCRAQKIANAVLPLIGGRGERERQMSGFKKLDAIFHTGGARQDELAAQTVIDFYQTKTGRKLRPVS